MDISILKDKYGIIRSVLIKAFYGVCIAVTAIFLITWLTTGKASFFGYRPIYVATGSMEPVIHAKSLVMTKTVNADEINIGDIVVYYKPVSIKNGLTMKGPKIVHRIIDRTDEGFIFKGDANPDADIFPVKDSQILFKVLNR